MPQLVQGTMRGAREGEIITPWPDTIHPVALPEPCRMYKLIIAPLIAFLFRLRFPALFAVTAVLFVLDFFIPDAMPFADETLLGLGAALLGSLKKRKDPPQNGAGR